MLLHHLVVDPQQQKRRHPLPHKQRRMLLLRSLKCQRSRNRRNRQSQKRARRRLRGVLLNCCGYLILLRFACRHAIVRHFSSPWALCPPSEMLSSLHACSPRQRSSRFFPSHHRGLLQMSSPALNPRPPKSCKPLKIKRITRSCEQIRRQPHSETQAHDSKDFAYKTSGINILKPILLCFEYFASRV